MNFKKTANVIQALAQSSTDPALKEEFINEVNQPQGAQRS